MKRHLPFMLTFLVIASGSTQPRTPKTSTKTSIKTRTYYAQPGVQSIETIDEFERSSTQSIQLIHFYYKNGSHKDPDYQSTSNLFALLEREIEDVITFGKVNLERKQLVPLAGKYKINQTPTILLLKDGIEVARLEGAIAITIDAIKTMVTNNFGPIIEKYKEWRRTREKELAEYRRAYGAYYSPYWYGGYGYSPWGWRWGAPYYGGYGGFGFGLGYGFGGYRRGYGRSCW